MIPIDQTIMQVGEGKITGNCFQANVASYFERSIEEVPNFCVDYGDSWFYEFYNWIRSNTEFSPIMYLVDGIDKMRERFPKGMYLVGGQSPRGSFDHSTIYEDCELVHDPHPDKAGITKVKTVIVFKRFQEEEIS
jgi:hypothetical protein